MPSDFPAMTLVAFDFDGTLTGSEMTVLLGEQCGVADELAMITEQAMNDEIEYADSLRRRVRLLEGLTGEQVRAAFDEIELRPGAVEVLNDLDTAGTDTAILTGGFERGVRHALKQAGASVDVIVANRLGVNDKKLTGEVEGPLIEGTKDIVLRAVADELGHSLAHTVVVGDGANDLPMLRAAGLAIGFRPKPAVAEDCDVSVVSMEELRDVFAEQSLLV